MNTNNAASDIPSVTNPYVLSRLENALTVTNINPVNIIKYLLFNILFIVPSRNFLLKSGIINKNIANINDWTIPTPKDVVKRVVKITPIYIMRGIKSGKAININSNISGIINPPFSINPTKVFTPPINGEIAIPKTMTSGANNITIDVTKSGESSNAIPE